MANPADTAETTESGFIGMSHYADALEPGAPSSGRDQPGGHHPMEVSDLQSLLVDEIKARPLRAVAWAAAAGLAIGFWAAR